MSVRGQSAEDRELFARAIDAAKVPANTRAEFEADFWKAVTLAPVALAIRTPAYPGVGEARAHLARLDRALRAVEAELEDAHDLGIYALDHGVGRLAREGPGKATAWAHLARFLDAPRRPFARQLSAWRRSAAFLTEHLEGVSHRPVDGGPRRFAADWAVSLVRKHGLKGAAPTLAAVLFEAIEGREGDGFEHLCKVASRSAKTAA